MDWNMLTASASALAPIDSSIPQSSVVNLFKIAKEWENADESTADGSLLNKKDDVDSTFSTKDFVESHTSWYDKDLQLWERDKSAVVESLMSRLRSAVDTGYVRDRVESPAFASSRSSGEDCRDTADIVMSHELEVLLSWIDRHSADASKVSEETIRVFSDNVRMFLTNCDANAHHFINYLLDLCRIGDPKKPEFMNNYLRTSLKHLEKRAWESLHLAFLNTKGIFLDSLISAGNNTPREIVTICMECADILFPAQTTNAISDSKERDTEYYFFIAYLLFRAGCLEGIRILLGQSDKYDIPAAMSRESYPTLFIDLCKLLLGVLSRQEDAGNKQVMLGSFTSEYFPTQQTTNFTLLGKGSNFYARLLLSIIYPNYYSPCDPETFATKEDYLWYKLHMLLGGSSTSLGMAAASLCHTLTQETTTIKAGEGNVIERVFAYAYSIALAGGVMESLRILMSAVQMSSVQAFALVFLVTFENCGLFESDDLKYIASSLWNLEHKAFRKGEASYLNQLAFSRKRNISPELKILVATLMPQQKAMMIMKYVVSENFNEAVNTCFIGTAATRNGMLVIGPLLQKLIKLSTRRSAAKLAILLMAQYSAHVGLWPAAFKCFYCIQDVDNCVSVLEACCCSLYDSPDKNSPSSLSSSDLCVYFSLMKSLAPSNERLMELTRIFDCIKVSVLVMNKEHKEAVMYAKKTRTFENVSHILRNESYQVYFNALVDYIMALKHMVSSGHQPQNLLTQPEAHSLVDLLESAYQNPRSDKNRAVDAIHMLMTFITIVPPKTGQQVV